MSSDFSYPQPSFQSSIYNPAFYLSLDSSGYLTYAYAQTLYLRKDDYRMDYLSGVIAGTALYSKALILDSSGNISGINRFGASTITGTLQTGFQPNKTSLGSLSGLMIDGNLSFSGSSRSISITGTSSYIDCREYRQSGTTYDLGLLEYINGDSFGTATPNTFLLCDSSSNIGGLSSVTATTLSCTNLRQGLTYYDLSTFITYIPTSLSLNDLSMGSQPMETNQL
ncbi:unnamed protein product [Phytophthora lilii]|uniref:Unnamed protein product n=1 Tax=Phytophthora lilii TaxID=2077276 RepID=A0A9W6UD56_9STRA|nr:unnamed protein product [Phytophthora lilii]